jgi:hypothetical protein
MSIRYCGSARRYAITAAAMRRRRPRLALPSSVAPQR